MFDIQQNMGVNWNEDNSNVWLKWHLVGISRDYSGKPITL